jgi:hypothetical protein
MPVDSTVRAKQIYVIYNLFLVLPLRFPSEGDRCTAFPMYEMIDNPPHWVDRTSLIATGLQQRTEPVVNDKQLHSLLITVYTREPAIDTLGKNRESKKGVKGNHGD